MRESPEIVDRAAKLDALRAFKDVLDNAGDEALNQPGAFKTLSRQQGMTSTLQAARDTAGAGNFAPKAVLSSLEDTFGPKVAAEEMLQLQKLSGALDRRAGASFVNSPEQYKALIAGTLLGEGPFSMLDKGMAYMMQLGMPLTLGSAAGRKYMTAGPTREMAARLLQEGTAAAGTGRAELYDLF